MSGEELEKVKGIVKRLYAGTGVTIGDIVDTAPWLDKLVNEVEELQKENEELKEKIKKDSISKNKIREIVEKSYNDIDYFNRDIRHDLEDLLGDSNE